MPLRLEPKIPPIEELWRERLDRVQHETLIVWRREDRMNPIRYARFPTCGSSRCPSAGLVQWEKADDLKAGFL